MICSSGGCGSVVSATTRDPAAPFFGGGQVSNSCLVGSVSHDCRQPEAVGARAIGSVWLRCLIGGCDGFSAAEW